MPVTAKNAEVPRVAVNGAMGHMGTMVIRQLASDAEVRLGAAVDAPRHPRLGEDVGTLVGLGASLGVFLSDDLDSDVNVMIDFSNPAGAMHRPQKVGHHGRLATRLQHLGRPQGGQRYAARGRTAPG